MEDVRRKLIDDPAKSRIVMEVPLGSRRLRKAHGSRTDVQRRAGWICRALAAVRGPAFRDDELQINIVGTGEWAIAQAARS
jgi:hypothetical protein